jgi:hypothetical protein
MEAEINWCQNWPPNQIRRSSWFDTGGEKKTFQIGLMLIPLKGPTHTQVQHESSISTGDTSLLMLHPPHRDNDPYVGCTILNSTHVKGPTRWLRISSCTNTLIYTHTLSRDTQVIQFIYTLLKKILTWVLEC